MIAAIIDLGTNTFHLLIAEIRADKTYSILHQENEAVQLGKGGIMNNELTIDAISRGLTTLKKYKEICDRNAVELIIAKGTSAIRNAENGLDFVNQVLEKTGIRIEIISGDREAELIFLGVNAAFNSNNEKSLIMDIGGGSVEFIIVQNNHISWKKSFDIGAARLLASYNFEKQLSESESEKLKNELEIKLNELLLELEKHSIFKLIGSAGSFETFAEMCECETTLNFTNEHKPLYQFDLNTFNKVHQWLILSTRTDRENNPAIISLRRDMIVPAVILSKLVLEKSKAKELWLSTFALKEGILVDYLNNIEL